MPVIFSVKEAHHLVGEKGIFAITAISWVSFYFHGRYIQDTRLSLRSRTNESYPIFNNKLAKDEGSEFPAEEDFYVDDTLPGGDTLQETFEYRNQLNPSYPKEVFIYANGTPKSSSNEIHSEEDS